MKKIKIKNTRTIHD